MEFIIDKDSIILKNASNITLIKPDKQNTKYIMTSLNKNTITSYIEKHGVKKYGDTFSYVMDDLVFTFTNDAFDTYGNIIDIANMKRKRDMLEAYKKAINSNTKIYKIMVLPLSKTKNISIFIDNRDIFTYQTFKERKELIYLNKMIDMYINKYGITSNPRGIIISNDKRLIGVDDYTKEIIDRKVLSYGKKH